MLDRLATGQLDTDIDLTAIILGVIAAVGSSFAAWVSHKTNKRVKTKNGKTIGEYVETMEGNIANTAAEIAKSLEEARLVREHEIAEAILHDSKQHVETEDLERARQRVHDELDTLKRIVSSLNVQNATEGGDRNGTGET